MEGGGWLSGAQGGNFECLVVVAPELGWIYIKRDAGRACRTWDHQAIALGVILPKR
jgi:hypothetical protein